MDKENINKMEKEPTYGKTYLPMIAWTRSDLQNI